jgi:hypothetical protein
MRQDCGDGSFVFAAEELRGRGGLHTAGDLPSHTNGTGSNFLSNRERRLPDPKDLRNFDLTFVAQVV